MKKKIFILLFSLTLFYSCSNDDDNASDNKLELSLSGTHWVKIDNDDIHFTFTSSTQYVYEEIDGTFPGTYVFNGTSGKMIETVDPDFELEFKVNGDILSANQDTSDPDFEALYKKQ